MERIIVVHWNKSSGPEPLIQYPPEKSPPPKDLFLKIWTKHELNKNSTLVDYVSEEDNRYVSIMQKFDGEIYFLVLSYDKNTKIDNLIESYPDILASISKNLIELINTNKITSAISEAYSTIKNYSKLDKEENLIDFFQDKIKNLIFTILREGVISKANLKEILRDNGFSRINLELLLLSFIREDLIIKKDLSGNRECYFLLKDISLMRIPPKKIDFTLEEDQSKEAYLDEYKKELTEFFINYDCTQNEEIKTLVSFLTDKLVFSLIKELRESVLSVNDCLNVINNNEALFNELLENKIIFEKKGLVFLFSDIRFIKFRPYYMIKRLVERRRANDISLDQFFTHLRLLIKNWDALTEIDYSIV
ncbi:MAG: hypothetical protein BAJALOKI2v1_50077 [Promethearchaeota archaeon]|nr:MAG: hypothetical protein BAJALOKI2v1_50077 [Candidatus Lokiarchaeota archaeon]